MRYIFSDDELNTLQEVYDLLPHEFNSQGVLPYYVPGLRTKATRERLDKQKKIVEDFSLLLERIRTAQNPKLIMENIDGTSQH